MAASESFAGPPTVAWAFCAGAPAPAPSGRIAVRSAVTLRLTTSVGLCSNSASTVITTGVIAAAGAVPLFQNCETMTAAAAEETLAMSSV